MLNHTTTTEKLQPHKYHQTPPTPDFSPCPHKSKPILCRNIEGLARIDSIILDALWLAIQQTPPRKRAEAIEALAERGIWLTASMEGARA